MKEESKNSVSFKKQLWHFILHLRWHYQLGILSGGFLLGGFLSAELDFRWFTIQFLNVHLLLFGGATAYNSYWDKDDGPIGGLQNPPPMSRWMWIASLVIQLIGFVLAIPMGGFYLLVYAMSMAFFWLYSSPVFRWKGRPVKSLIAIGLSTGFSSVLLGYLAAGNASFLPIIFIAALGVSLILLSLYPLSQVYQQEADRSRGDRTFAIHYGIKKVLLFFEIAFLSGLLLIAGSIAFLHPPMGIIFGIIGATTGWVIRTKLKNLKAQEEDYSQVMRIKYVASLSFVAFLVAALLLKHLKIDGISKLADLLLM